MPDRRTVLVVVGGLAFTLVACIVGAIVLAAIGKDVPDVVKELGVGALGALAGILARTATEPGPIQPVAVMNTPAAPVPVDPQGGHTETAFVIEVAILLILVAVALRMLGAI